jgi:hypothetical protein
MGDILNSEDELLVSRLRSALAKVAAAAGGEAAGGSQDAVGAALDGTELVMRGELASGNVGLLPALLPGFVFLVALPVVDQDAALELSQGLERAKSPAITDRHDLEVESPGRRSPSRSLDDRR